TARSTGTTPGPATRAEDPGGATLAESGDRLPLLGQVARPPVVGPVGLHPVAHLGRRDVLGRHLLVGRDRLAGEDLDRELHRDLAGAGGERDGAALAVLAHPLQPTVVLVAGGEDDLLQAAGLLERLGHAEAHLPGRGEHAVDARVAYQQALGDALRLGAAPLTVVGRDELHAGVL